MSRDLLRLVAQLAGHHRCGGAANRRAAAGVSAQPVRRVIRVALLNLNVGSRDAQLLGNDLGKGRLVPLSLALDAELEDRLAGGMDPQLRGVEHPQAGDVVVLPRAGPDHLSEAGDPDTHQLALLPFFRLLLAKLLITDFVERQAQCLLVLAAVVLEAGR